MKQKHQQELEKEPFYNIKDEEFGEEVKLKIDESSFKGGVPFKCHGKNSILIDKRVSFNDFEFTYPAWQCSKCKKEFLDFEQAKRYEKFLIMKRSLEQNLITIERNMNFDGKTFFFRFPKELTNNLSKKDLVDIKLLTPDGRMFLVEIKHGKNER
ncbi:hypothetical protein HYU09_03185 [Candidatus Woesearchaeota archaeon]|nr:hypothetical protein [Candidatus Woesearchaeota archaeon]